VVFDVNQTEFASDYQREVWKIGTHIVPLEVSLADVTDPEVRDGCTQIYQCTMQILADMYKNPDNYAPVRPLDYLYFIFWRLIGARDKARVFPPVLKKEYKVVLEKLRFFGFAYDVESARLTNAKYPLFVEYWTKLYERVSKRKSVSSVHLCDFRMFAKTYNRTIDDLLRSLPDEYKEYFKELHNYALAQGARLEPPKYYGRFRYLIGKKHILQMDNHPATIAVPYMNQYTIGDNVGEFQNFLQVAKQQQDHDAVITYIQKNISVCTGCANRATGRKKLDERCGKWVDICGARRYLAMCWPSVGKHHHGSRQQYYTAEDVVMLKRMMDIRIKQIAMV